MGLLVRRDFLAKFNEVDDDAMQILVTGRVGRLPLRGPQGALDLYVVYMPTGSNTSWERIQIMRTIAMHMQSQSQVLSLVMGDFNFAAHVRDRWSKVQGNWSGDTDKVDQQEFNKLLGGPFHLHEIHQPSFTCDSARARSRIDRIYSNHHACDQLDRSYSCNVLLWTDLSQHRPLSFNRVSPNRTRKKTTFPTGPLNHPDWQRRVKLRYDEDLTTDSLRDNVMRRTIILKRAMRTVAQTMHREGVIVQKMERDDQVGWTMSFLRAAEEVNLTRMQKCAQAYPYIATQVPPNDPNARLHRGMAALREHALQLTKDAISDDLQALRQCLGDSHGHCYEQQKEHILRKLKRTLPGSTNTPLGAIQTNQGHVTTDTLAIAAALQDHWQHVFKRKPIDGTLLERWIDAMPHLLPVESATAPPTTGVPPTPAARVPRDNACCANTRGATNERTTSRSPRRSIQARGQATQRNLPPEAHWRIRRRDIQSAIKGAGKSSPGPDGIPFQAWKAMGDLAVDVLWNVAKLLEAETAGEVIRAAYADEVNGGGHDYNLGNLVCLGKKPAGNDPVEGDFFTPEGTRPLSIVNCDNRIVASAARIRWEEHLAGWVGNEQQGFLRGRSILKNLIDIDTESMSVSLKSQSGAMVLFDFKAAFPSISQEYMLSILAKIGVPECARQVVTWLYDENKCQLSFRGAVHPGFAMTAGVRQGCPLSPLLYAVISDVLLARILDECPGICVRAYADDTALVTNDFWRDAPILQRIFDEFSSISGLHLNMAKCVIIPLTTTPLQRFRERLADDLPE